MKTVLRCIRGFIFVILYRTGWDPSASCSLSWGRCCVTSAHVTISFWLGEFQGTPNMQVTYDIQCVLELVVTFHRFAFTILVSSVSGASCLKLILAINLLIYDVSVIRNISL